MNEKSGEVYSIAKENAPLPYCTVSKSVQEGKNSIGIFSLGADTDISAETHPQGKLILAALGDLNVFWKEGKEVSLKEEDALILKGGETAGMKSKKGSVYTEVSLKKEDFMNPSIKAGEVFQLKDLLPYQEGKIVNMDIVKGDGMKFALLSFDKGTGLSEHAAPGEAIVFALDGKGIIGYEGKEYPIEAGENFHFAKGGKHYVKAVTPFKMALLLTLE